jgi:hypothetical protein
VLALLSPLGRHGHFYAVAAATAVCWWLFGVHATVRKLFTGLYRTPPLYTSLALGAALWPASVWLGRLFDAGGGSRAALVGGAILLGLHGWIEVAAALVLVTAYLAPDADLFLWVACPSLAGHLLEVMVLDDVVEKRLLPRVQRALRAGQRIRALTLAATSLGLTPFVSAEAREEVYLYLSTTCSMTGAWRAARWWARRTVRGPARRGYVEAQINALRNVGHAEQARRGSTPRSPRSPRPANLPPARPITGGWSGSPACRPRSASRDPRTTSSTSRGNSSAFTGTGATWRARWPRPNTAWISWAPRNRPRACSARRWAPRSGRRPAASTST